MSTKILAVALAAPVLAAGALVACSSDSSSAPEPAEAAEPLEGGGSGERAGGSSKPSSKAPKRRRGVVLRVRNTPFGKVIHEKRSGLAAYLFTKEKRGGKPRCYGSCAEVWPPIKTRGRPVAGSGVSRRKLGTVKRRRGGRMVTYRGHPLYFYAGDSPNSILCNDVVEFGGGWFVIGPDGRPASG